MGRWICTERCRALRLSFEAGDIIENSVNPLAGHFDAYEGDVPLPSNFHRSTDLDGTYYYGAIGWDDIRVPMTGSKTGGAKEPGFSKLIDDGAGSQGIYAMMFDANNEEELFFGVQMSHSYKTGSPIHAHLHWVPTADGGVGELVNWGLEYSIQQIGREFPPSTIISGNKSIVVEDLIAGKHYATELGIIDMSGIDIVSAMIMGRVFRDAGGVLGTDDYGSDAALLEVDFHYEIDSLGSGRQFEK